MTTHRDLSKSWESAGRFEEVQRHLTLGEEG